MFWLLELLEHAHDAPKLHVPCFSVPTMGIEALLSQDLQLQRLKAQAGHPTLFPICQLKVFMLLGPAGPENYAKQYASLDPKKMSDGMSKYTSDSLPDSLTTTIADGLPGRLSEDLTHEMPLDI